MALSLKRPSLSHVHIIFLILNAWAFEVFSLMHNPEILSNVWCFYNASHQACAQPILEHPADIVVLDAMLMRIVQDFLRNDF